LRCLRGAGWNSTILSTLSVNCREKIVCVENQQEEHMGSFKNISADELRSYMAGHHEKEFMLVDVRQLKEYVAGHIAGANLIPLGELSARMIELPPDRDIIFY
jgi:3-mercaptopyruvate sulfurtransferase SseA